MSRSLRRSAFAAVVSTAALVFAAPEPLPQLGDPSGEIQNSRFQFEGEVNANAVYVRSGPSDNDYATMKLDKGARVIVVGAGKFEWLKILPPEGSFCYVAKAYVEKRGDGKIGRVTNALNVRVGSQLLPMKTKVASRLEPGQDVQIIGEQDEYFKIVPPAGVYLYISKQFVEPVRRVEVPGIADGPSVTDAAPNAPRPPAEVTEPTPSTPPILADATPAARPVETAPPLDQPSNNAAAIIDPSIASPTKPDEPVLTQTPADPDLPAIAATGATPGGASSATPVTTPRAAPSDTVAAELEFDRLEALLREVADRPVQQQPVPELLAGYEKLAASDALPESMRRQAEYRVSTLRVHNQNRTLILAHERDRQSREQELIALKREGDELVERLKTTGIIFYSAVGTLRPSSLQTGGEGTLYRLTDPVTGRTLVYIRSTDPRVVSMMGLFVGVQGEIIDDQQWKLKVITPTDIEPVDQRKVNHSVAAKIIPPSLMPGGALVGERHND